MINLKIKTPTEMSTAIFERAMREFEKEWGKSLNGKESDEEREFITKAEEVKTDVENVLDNVQFDMQKGTLLQIDLGPSGSEARKRWELSIYRPGGIAEGDILMYTGWFVKKVKIMDASNQDPDLSEMFSNKIQLFVKAGKEEVWAGLIPNFFYAILTEGSGGICTEPLFEQEHFLSLNKALIKAVVTPNTVSLTELELSTKMEAQNQENKNLSAALNLQSPTSKDSETNG